MRNPPIERRLPPSPPLALLERTTELIQAKLAQNPGDCSLLHKLAVLYRKRGLLEKASDVYEEIATVAPDDAVAARLFDIFSIGSIAGTDSPDGTQAAPFVMLENFLPAAEHAELLPLMMSHREEFEASLVGEGDYRPEIRESRTLAGPRPEKKRFRQRVQKELPGVIERLGLKRFDIDLIEVKIRTYQHGDFFEVHQDRTEQNHRQVSYVFFFHREPRAYQGGELLLFDTDVDADTYTEGVFTRIVPRNNAIVFFPSCYYHTVVPVDCPSREFVDARFVINGHVHEAVAEHAQAA